LIDLVNRLGPRGRQRAAQRRGLGHGAR